MTTEVRKLIINVIARMDGKKRKAELMNIRKFIKNSYFLKGKKRKLYKLIDSNIK